MQYAFYQLDTPQTAINTFTDGYLQWQKNRRKHTEEAEDQAVASSAARMTALLSARDVNLTKSFASALPDPYYQAECLRIILSSCNANQKDEARNLIDQILSITNKISSDQERSLCTADTSIALYRFDPGQSLKLTDKIANPFHKTFALAVMASQSNNAKAEAGVLLADACKTFSDAGTTSGKAYAGYVLARAFLGENFGAASSIVDLSSFPAQPW
jgi:hypothetical protein